LPRSRKRRTVKARKNPQSAYSKEQSRGKKRSDNITKFLAGALILALVAGGLIYFFAYRGGGSGKEVTTASGLKYVDIVEGQGASPKPGQIVSVKYTGTLVNGTKFDSSYDHPGGQPITFPIGRARVIPGWDEGLMTMKVGGKRKLIVPPKLGYDTLGKPPDIPPNATLLFDVELVDVK
jgi:peptidylprolyl isomerase